MKSTKFIVELKEHLANSDFVYLRNLYTPIIGIKAVAIFQLLHDYHIMNKQNNDFYFFKDLASCLNISEVEAIKERQKLEAIGLIRVFEKGDNIHFIIKLNRPLSPLALKSNSLLYKDFINKQGELQFERIYFSTKNREHGKDEFKEITIKYQDLFKIPQPEKVQNTQMIQMPTTKSIEEAKLGLTSEQFIFYLLNKRPSPLQSNTITKLKQLNLSTLSINEIIDYSFVINNKSIISSHILTIANDLATKDIISPKKIAAELNSAKKSRLSQFGNRKRKQEEVPDDWSEYFDLLGGN